MNQRPPRRYYRVFRCCWAVVASCVMAAPVGSAFWPTIAFNMPLDHKGAPPDSRVGSENWVDVRADAGWEPVAAVPLAGLEIQQVIVTTIDGQQITTTIEQIASDGKITGDNIPEGLTVDQVRSIEMPRQATPPNGQAIRVILPAGGRMFAESVSVAQGKLNLLASGTSEEISLESVVAIKWRESSMVDRLLGQRSTDSDQVVVETPSGERVVPGILEEINATHVVLNYRGESRRIAIEKVVAVLPADLGLAAPGYPLATVDMTDSSKIVGQLLSLDSEKVQLQITGKHSIALPTGSIVRIGVDAGRVVYLSAIELADVQQSSAFAAPRPWQRNRSVEGNPLRLKMPDGQVRTFENGIGVQSFARLSFQVPEGFDTFAAIVGIDRETGGLGDCEMIVEADGIRVWAGRVRGSDPAQELQLDIGDARELTLIVDYGEDFDLADHADWCRARLIRTD